MWQLKDFWPIITYELHGFRYYRTYENSQITAVDMHKEATDGEALIRYPMIKEQQIRYQN